MSVRENCDIETVSGRFMEKTAAVVRKEKYESRRDITAVGGRVSKNADG